MLTIGIQVITELLFKRKARKARAQRTFRLALLNLIQIMILEEQG